MPFTKLPPDTGFSVDSRSPGIDRIALKSANRWFGRDKLTKILEGYHRSDLSDSALRTDVEGFNITHTPRLSCPIYEAVYASVKREFTPTELLIPLTMGGSALSPGMPRDKAPGLPWSKRGYRTKRDVIADKSAMQEIRTEWIKIGKGYKVDLPDCQIFYRAQIAPTEKNKIRAVWGFPMSVFLEESRFVYPYLDWITNRKDDYPLAYGVEMANGGMGYIHDAYLKFEPRCVTMMDWSKFDKTVPAWLIRDAFDILFGCFDMSQVKASDGLFYPVNPEISINRFKKLVRYFINTPFRFCDGTRYRKDGGVPSGSGFTNIIDSIVNALMTRYCFYQTTGSLPVFDIFMGDDSVVFTDVIPSLEQIALVADKWFGAKLNLDKSYVTSNPRNIQFLGFYNEYGYPVRSQDFLVASWVYPERKQDPDPVFTAVRAVGQLWSTLNPSMAMPWYHAINDIVHEYDLQPNWLEDHLAMHPSRLKFLNIYGLRKTDIFMPKMDGQSLISVVCPPRRTQKRTPGRRATNIMELYSDDTTRHIVTLASVLVDET